MFPFFILWLGIAVFLVWSGMSTIGAIALGLVICLVLAALGVGG